MPKNEGVNGLGQAELQMLVKLHSSHIYNWSNANNPNVRPSAEVKQALLDVVARMYETVEALQVKEPIKQ